MKALAAGSRQTAARLPILGLLVIPVGLALARVPLPWAVALVTGSLGGVLLLLHPMLGLIPLLLSIPMARLGGLTIGGMRVSPAQTILAGMLLASLAQMAARGQIRCPHPPLLLPFLLLLGAMLASLPGTPSIRMTLKELIK